MNTRYPLLALLLLSSLSRGFAQNHGELTINDVRARFYAHGLVGYDLNTGQPEFEIPVGMSTHPLYSGGMWIGGIDGADMLHGAVMMYEPNWEGGPDYYTGPLTTDGSASTNADVMAQYDQVWSVTRAEVTAHLDYYNCLADPGCDIASEFPNGYEIPASILNWPAINTTPGYDLYLAPFYDFNGDGDYDPTDGDAPCILGDEALFFVFNDKGGPHLKSGMLPIGIEVQAMPFAYHAPGSWKDQTVFVRYHLINRSTLTVGDTRLGFFNDFDLGCSNDDFIGVDPPRNLAYIYNRDNVDENCNATLGYGTQPPAFGQVVLKGPLLDPDAQDNAADNSLPSWNGTGFGDAQVDNERSGVDRFIYFNRESASCCNDPVMGPDFYHYLDGYWKDGTPMTYGGSGYSTDPDAVPSTFMYPGDADPVGAGTNGEPQSPWSDTDTVLMDRRGLIGFNGFTMEPGEHVDLLFAYVYARATSGGPQASLSMLKAQVDSVRAFANTLPIWNTSEMDGFIGQCADYATLSVKEEPRTGRLDIFPIPASDQVRIDADERLAGELLLVFDATGRTVATHRLTPGVNKLDISTLARGLYGCEVRSTKVRYTGTLIKE